MSLIFWLIMYIVDLFEKRRNPETNTKTTALKELGKYAGRPDIFVSFTDDVTRGKGQHAKSVNRPVPKLGINPINHYNTPLGIYTYPIDYVLSRSGKVPFAGNLPYIWVVESTGNLLDLCSYTDADLESDLEKLEDISHYTTHVRENMRSASVQTPGGKLWYVLMKLSDSYGNSNKIKPTTAWSKLIKKLGYTGAHDSCGHGIIHSSEPTQAFFVSRESFKTLEVIDNDLHKKGPSYTMSYLSKNPKLLFEQYSSGNVSGMLLAAVVKDEIEKSQQGIGNGWLDNVSDFIDSTVINKLKEREVLIELLFPYISNSHAIDIMKSQVLENSDNDRHLAFYLNATYKRKELVTWLKTNILSNARALKFHPFDVIEHTNTSACKVFDSSFAQFLPDNSIGQRLYLFEKLGPLSKEAALINDWTFVRLSVTGIIPFNNQRIINVLNSVKTHQFWLWFSDDRLISKLSDNDIFSILNHKGKNFLLSTMDFFNDYFRDEETVTRLRNIIDLIIKQ